MILSSRSSAYELDYNFHKSNSTYFTDFDVARCQLVTWLMMNGMRKVAAEMNAANKTTGILSPHLGGVMCNFKREIKPFEKFEIWTRVLTWDRKWLYVVSHWVKSGSVKPSAYTMQPWRKTGLKQNDNMNGEGSRNRDTMKQDSKEGSTGSQPPTIYATALAKYVCKKGRLTIAPERILQASGLLPPKPEGLQDASIPATPSPDPQAVTSEEGAPATLPSLVPSPALSKITSKEAAEAAIETALTSDEDQEAWDWNRVEEERLKGLKLAEMYNGLEALGGTFTGEGEIALGRWSDLL